MKISTKLKFIAGDVSPTLEKQFCTKVAEVYEEEVVDDRALKVLPAGRMIFLQGEEGLVNEAPSVKMGSVSRPFQPPVRPQSSAEIARQIYINMLNLRNFYQQLGRMNAEHAQTFEDLQAELSIVTVAMLRICQSLSRDRRNSFETPFQVQLSSFCSGIVQAERLQKKILFDLRALQRSVEGQNLLSQILIIYLTMQSQNETVVEIRRQEC